MWATGAMQGLLWASMHSLCFPSSPASLGGALLLGGMLCVGRPITTWSSQLPREGHPENRPGWHLVERVIGVMRTWPSARGARNPAVPSATPHRLHAKFSRPRLGSRLLVKPPRFLSTTDVGRELPKLRAELTLESAWDIGGRWAAGGFSRPFCETRVVAALQTASLSNVAVVRIGVLFIEMHLPIRCWSAFGSLRPSSSWGSDVEREAFPKDGRHVKPRPGAGGLQPRCPRAGEDVLAACRRPRSWRSAGRSSRSRSRGSDGFHLLHPGKWLGPPEPGAPLSTQHASITYRGLEGTGR